MAENHFPWENTFEPFRLFGNIYFTGTIPASTHVVKTSDGLILFDPGYQHSLYIVIDNMYRMGLNPHDIKYIFITHGHIDHFGAAKALRELTGAKIVLGEPDRDYANGKLDLSWAKELGLEYKETFEADILINDGDEITIGDTTVRAVATPGHTPGVMSYIFNATDGEKTLTAGLVGGIGMNSMAKEFLDKYGLSYSCRDDFINSMERLKKEKVDLHIPNHLPPAYARQKLEEIKNGNPDAFIDKEEWVRCAEEAKQRLIKLIEQENK